MGCALIFPGIVFVPVFQQRLLQESDFSQAGYDMRQFVARNYVLASFSMVFTFLSYCTFHWVLKRLLLLTENILTKLGEETMLIVHNPISNETTIPTSGYAMYLARSFLGIKKMSSITESF